MVISKLPRAGLGNKLFVWAHGVIFAHHNKMKHVTVGWVQFMIGPLLRGEKSARMYRNYFVNDAGILQSVLYNYKSCKKLSYKDCNLKVDDVKQNYCFTEIPHWDDYFYLVRENRNLVKLCFFKMLTTFYRQKYEQLDAPAIGVHIRLGDFKTLNNNQDFAKVGHTRTPQDYFIKIINEIRRKCGANVPATIFTDGNESEIKPLLDLGNVSLSNNQNDLIDLMHLSKSKMIILSAGSTFGQWAGFLSNSIIIHHPDHYHSNIRNTSDDNSIYEGVWTDDIVITNKLFDEKFN